ncbi:MAG: N-acetylmuramoyl-L-alanine amidase [Candidatus Brocadiia bacterium]
MGLFIQRISAFRRHRRAIFMLVVCLAVYGTFIQGCQSTGTESHEPKPREEPSGEGADQNDETPSEARLSQPTLGAQHGTSYAQLNIPDRPDTDGDLGVTLGRTWRSIVVHHSHTRSGSMESFDQYHREERGWKGVGYHFVIGNGTGSPDGKVEVTFRWEDQMHGAHAGVDRHNQHGIGICLVGDFDQQRPTARQLASLIALVNYLQKRCGIPTSDILLHRHIKNTRCPGKNFPFYRFISLLNQ